MKKSTLALAVAAALTGFGSVAQADTTLYGSARVSVDYDSKDSTYLFLNGDVVERTSVGSDVWDVFNNASRLGVRGEEDLGGGLSAIYNYEFGVDTTEGTSFTNGRPAWVGLKGSNWGQVTVGTQWTPYYNTVGGFGDIFNSSKVYDNDAYLGNSYGLRMDNSVIYNSPNWNGFNLQAMLVMNGNGGSRLANVSDDVDMWNIGASYKNGPFVVGGTYMALNDSNDNIVLRTIKNGDLVITEVDDDLDQWGLVAGYIAGPFGVTLTYEDGNLNTLYAGTTRNIYVTGRYTFGNNKIYASYGYVTPDDSRVPADFGGTQGFIMQDDFQNFALGYQYDLSKRTRLWVEYVGKYVDDSYLANELTTGLYGESQTVSIGTRHDF